MRSAPMAAAASVFLLLAPPVSAQMSDDAALPSVELPDELERVLTDYETAWQEGDAAALAALFTADGYVLAPGHDPVHGREAIEAHYQGRGGPLSLRAYAFATGDSVGYVLGGYAATPGMPDGGKFTLTLRRGPDDRWWIVSDMDNRNRAAP